jgi:hypothetical protein
MDVATAALKEALWLSKNPAYEEKPATIREFLGAKYLNIDGYMRPGVVSALEEVFGTDVDPDRIAKFERALMTGGIGIGKTTYASIALPYMVHCTLCLRDPQDFYGLIPGSRIAFMMMSTSEKQAKEVLFGDLVARIDRSPWFKKHPRDPKINSLLKFGKDVWIVPGDSQETTFEGYNILCGIIDEMDSHKTTEDKDYADVGFDTIESRIASRFKAADNSGHRGLIICIGQMKKGNGFAARKYREFLADPKASVVRMTIWESLGWEKYSLPDGTRDSFVYDTKRKQIISGKLSEFITPGDMYIEVPSAYRTQFLNNPEKALRDLAGIPPVTSDPFISLVDRVESCRDRWVERVGVDSPVDANPTNPVFADWFTAENDPRKRAVHIDIAYSGNGDALGISMGYVDHWVEIEGDSKPYIVIDCIYRVRAVPGTEILLSDIRGVVYELARRGFKILDVTLDGFQSKETQQALSKRRYRTTYLSIDRKTLPYEDLREAIYEERLEFPKYMTLLRKGDTSEVEIALKELTELMTSGNKIDHPVGGSKDVADSLAGVVTTLAGGRTMYGRPGRLAAPPPGFIALTPGATLRRDFDLSAHRSGKPDDSLTSLIPPRLRRG